MIRSLICVTLVVAAIATAYAGPTLSTGGTFSSHVPRQPVITATANLVNSAAVRRSGGTRDRIDYFFTTLAWPRYRITYYNDTRNLLQYFRYRVGIAGITEFTGGTWQLSNVISRIRLINRPATDWSSMIPPTTVTNADGSTYELYSTTISGLGNQAGATVTLTARLATGFGVATDASGTVDIELAANKIKFDVVVQNYNYTQPESQLAIVTVIQSIAARELVTGNSTGGSDRIDIGSGGHFMWFNAAWHTFKNGTAGMSPITTNEPSGDLTEEWQLAPEYKALDNDADASETTDVAVHILAGSEDHPTKIEWDPETSVDETAGARAAAAASLATAAILAIMASISLI